MQPTLAFLAALLAVGPTFAADAPILLPPAATVTPSPVVATRPEPAAEIALPTGRGGRAPFSIVRIAHATVLIDFDGKRILTDPWFTEAPEFHQGESLGMSAADLPKLAAIVVSHAHYDHFDIENFARQYANKATPLYVPFDDMAERARRAGFTDVRRLAVGESAVVDGVQITAAAARHGVPEVTYFLRSGGNTVYFAADTLLTPEVRALASFAPVDVVLVPINGLNVAGRPVVMSAEEAANLAGILEAAVAIPIHYRFRAGPLNEGTLLTYNGDPTRFLRTLQIAAPRTKGVILEPGQLQRFTGETAPR